MWSKNPQEIVRDYFPSATDAEVEHIAWSRTGFPRFFRGTSAWEHEAQFRDQIKAYRCALQMNERACDLCSRWVETADVEEFDASTCRRCRDALSRNRHDRD